MTQEQKLHYYKGGKFTATYSPKSNDTKDYYKKGRIIEIYQNCLILPIEAEEYPGRNWEGQLRLNSPDIYGWFPEEDVEDIQMINEFVDYPEKTKKFKYKLTYTEDKQLLPNFGKGRWSLPLVVYRDYDCESDEYVRNLSKPQATKIERQTIDLLSNEASSWEMLKL